jgi:hypothetical protein
MRCFREQCSQLRSVEGPRHAAVVCDSQARLQLQDLGIEVDHRVARREVARCMVQARCDRRRTGGALRLAIRVGLEHEFSDVRNIDAEARVRAVGLALIDQPAARWHVHVQHLRAIRPADDLRRRQRPRAEPVFEPR